MHCKALHNQQSQNNQQSYDNYHKRHSLQTTADGVSDHQRENRVNLISTSRQSVCVCVCVTHAAEAGNEAERGATIQREGKEVLHAQRGWRSGQRSSNQRWHQSALTRVTWGGRERQRSHARLWDDTRPQAHVQPLESKRLIIKCVFL